MKWRKDKAKPDSSYDIDGDGTVSAKDYFFAKLFDTNKNGFLSPSEKERCHAALIDENFEENFVFGLENKTVVPDSKDINILKDRTM